MLSIKPRPRERFNKFLWFWEAREERRSQRQTHNTHPRKDGKGERTSRWQVYHLFTKKGKGAFSGDNRRQVLTTAIKVKFRSVETERGLRVVPARGEGKGLL